MRLPASLFIILLFSACLKKNNGCPFQESNTIASVSEQHAIESYLNSNGLTAVKHSSGVYYNIIGQGSGITPTLCSVINVTYTGKLTDGRIFDQQSGFSFELGRTIEGWKKGIPLIQKGGKITLYIPPSLGYGAQGASDSNGNYIVPPNSILIFDVDLLDVQ